jgi:hypothetical protein
MLFIYSVPMTSPNAAYWSTCRKHKLADIRESLWVPATSMRETAGIDLLFRTIIKKRSSTKIAPFREFSSCPEDFRVVLLDHFLTLYLCSFWYKSTWIFKKWSQFRIIHFLKRLLGAIWLFETPFRGWNDFYMDYSTDTPTHPSTQYR